MTAEHALVYNDESPSDSSFCGRLAAYLGNDMPRTPSRSHGLDGWLRNAGSTESHCGVSTGYADPLQW